MIAALADKKIREIIRTIADHHGTEPKNVKIFMQLDKTEKFIVVHPYINGEYKAPTTIKKLLNS